MKRTSIALFVASLGLFLLFLANLSPGVSAQLPMPKDDGGGSDPTGAPATPVEVTNALTGTMAVKNFPLRQEVFGTVEVGNLPLDETGAVRVSQLNNLPPENFAVFFVPVGEIINEESALNYRSEWFPTGGAKQISVLAILERDDFGIVDHTIIGTAFFRHAPGIPRIETRVEGSISCGNCTTSILGPEALVEHIRGVNSAFEVRGFSVYLSF